MEKEGFERIKEYFKNVETTEEHNGCRCSVGETLTIVILGSICGLRNASQIHQWASSSQVAEFLSEKIKIEKIPCYNWMLNKEPLLNVRFLKQCSIVCSIVTHYWLFLKIDFRAAEQELLTAVKEDFCRIIQMY
jgi:hypothetical protein